MSESDQARDLGARIDAVIESNEDRLLCLVQELIATNSQIPPHGDERRLAKLLLQRMTELDLGEAQVVASVPERPNLILRIPGQGGGPTLMFNGHIDTKPVGDAREQWLSDPHEPRISDGLLYGLGANDMKAAVGAMIYGAFALRAAGIALRGDLVLAFVADEENGATYGAKYLAPLLQNVDAALIGEPSGWTHDWQGIHLVSRGVCCFRVRLSGTQMHSSLSDRLPSVNASLKAAEAMLSIRNDLELQFSPHPLGGIGPTLNVGVLVSGGTYFGVVPGNAEFACDLRTVPGMTRDGVEDALQKWAGRIRQQNPGLGVEVVFEEGLDWVPWSEIAADHPLVTTVESSAEAVLGRIPPRSVFPGGTDAPWFAMEGIPTLPSFGPGILTSAHGPNEFVSLESIPQAARIYARIAAAYCGVAN